MREGDHVSAVRYYFNLGSSLRIIYSGMCMKVIM